MKDNTTYLKDENLLSLLSLNNMIVPEIQREYVWGKSDNKEVLEKFLENIKNNSDDCDKCKQAHKKKDINIGFLYSYKPSYVTVDNERYLDEFLIDGQQRYTTLFLLLAFLAVKENRIKDFLLLVRFDVENEIINFDYKVRDLTHRFLIDFLGTLEKSKENMKIEDILPIEKNGLYTIPQTWFLSDYKADMTIQAMLGALRTISEVFDDNALYFDYILTAIRFWHFKTEATSQGEELYITMNSRGEKLTGNEEEKAQILPSDDLLKWGEKWEKWQDFFWKNRDKNPNADNGFNNFLNCIKALTKFNNAELTHSEIETYYYALCRLFTFEKSEFDWLQKCVLEVKEILNYKNTDWFADHTNPNKGTEQNRMIFVWFILKLLRSENNELTVENHIIRALRFIWIRYNNFNRAVASISPLVDAWKTKQIPAKYFTDDEKTFTDDEKIKYKFLDINNLMNKEFTEDEKIMWKIEDHPLNLNGRDLGAVNLSHIVDFSKTPNLQTIFNNFNELFPSKECNSEYEKPLKSLLLHYKDKQNNPFWNRVSPWYYDNYDCSDWRRIIRGNIFKEVFALIFNSSNQCVIDDLLKQKKREFYSQYENIQEIRNRNLSERRQLIVYSDLIGDIWKYGNIAFGKTIENETQVFNNEREIYSLGRYLQGSYDTLWNKVKEKNIDDELQRVFDTYTKPEN